MQNSFDSFLKECVETKVGEFVLKEKLYHKYCSFCKSNKVPYESNQNFGSMLKSIGYHEARPSINGKRYFAWNGICLKNPINPPINVQPNCPFCGKTQLQNPLKSWEYGKMIVKRTKERTLWGNAVRCSRYKCDCGKLFNYYLLSSKKSWTVPKPK